MPFGFGWPEFTILLIVAAVVGGIVLMFRADKEPRFPSSFSTYSSTDRSGDDKDAMPANAAPYNHEEPKETMMTDESWSQGRLAPERLSPGTGTHYIHEYLRASTIAESKGGFGMGMAQEKASPYSVDRVESHLNSRAEEGWRLVSMEPHWWHERQVISAAMSITRPLAIVGWYLTFERRE